VIDYMGKCAILIAETWDGDCIMSHKISQQRALRSAFASTRMEGFRITPQIEADTKQILAGKLSVDEYVKQAKQRIVERKESGKYGNV
jgi:hypothetical protein